MKKVRVGVLGAHRGRTMIQYCKQAENAYHPVYLRTLFLADHRL